MLPPRFSGAAPWLFFLCCCVVDFPLIYSLAHISPAANNGSSFHYAIFVVIFAYISFTCVAEESHWRPSRFAKSCFTRPLGKLDSGYSVFQQRIMVYLYALSLSLSLLSTLADTYLYAIAGD